MVSSDALDGLLYPRSSGSLDAGDDTTGSIDEEFQSIGEPVPSPHGIISRFARSIPGSRESGEGILAVEP